MLNRKERERDFRKQLIAEAAFRLFTETSFEGVTVQDIATAAEIGKGTIYQYFDNKDDILIYILSENLDRLNQNIEEQCSQEADVVKALNAYLTLQYRSHSSYGPLLMSLYRRRLEGAIKSEVFEDLLLKRQRKIEQVAGMIERGIQAGILMEVDKYKMAVLLNNIVRGYCLGNLEEKREANEESRDLELIKAVLTEGILTSKGGHTL